MQKLRAALFVFVMLFAAKAHATNCVPGAQAQCACPGGGTGVQICSDDGSRLGACSNCTIIQSQPVQMQPMQPMQPMYGPLTPRSRMRRRMPGLYGGGLAVMLLGALLVPIGTGVIVFGAADGGCDHHDDDKVCTAGGAVFGVGLFALGGGITMMIIGGQKVPAVEEGAPQAWWVPTPQISPRGGSLTWTF